MLRLFAHKKRRASILDLSTTKPSSSRHAAETPAYETPILHVCKKQIPPAATDVNSPALIMPKPKHAIPPAQRVLDCGENDKTELEESEEEMYRQRAASLDHSWNQCTAEGEAASMDHVKALQRQVYLIQQQCELERAQWKQREQEHRVREREMMEKICRTQDQLRMALAGRSSSSSNYGSRPPSRPRSAMMLEEHIDRGCFEEDPAYGCHLNRRGAPLRQQRRSVPSPLPRRRSATSIHRHAGWGSSLESDQEEEEDDDEGYFLANSFSRVPRYYPRPRPSESMPVQQHQQRRRQQRPTSYYRYV